jgi:hypothetical protein
VVDESDNYNGGESSSSSSSSTLSEGGRTSDPDTDFDEEEQFIALELKRVNFPQEQKLTQGVGEAAVPLNKTFTPLQEPSFKKKEFLQNSSKPTLFTPREKKKLKKLRKKMFRKLNCGRCVDAIRGCCDSNGERDIFFHFLIFFLE